MMDLYLFFDVDGVLNKESDWRRNNYIDPACVRVLAQISEMLSKRGFCVHFFLCSTWSDGVGKGGEASISSLELALAGANIRIEGSTPHSNKSRQEEIEFCIRRYGMQYYMVVDADPSRYLFPKRINLFVPDAKTGLIGRDIARMLRASKRMYHS